MRGKASKSKIPQLLYPDLARMSLEGKSLQNIADWLAENHNIEVSIMTVSRALVRQREERRETIAARRQQIDDSVVEDIRKSVTSDLDTLTNIDKALAEHHATLAELSTPLPPRKESGDSIEERKLQLTERRVRIQAMRAAAGVGRARQELRMRRLSLGLGLPEVGTAESGIVIKVLKPPTEIDDGKEG